MKRIFALQIKIFLALLLLGQQINAQSTFNRTDIQFIRNGDTLQLSQTGGLNSPQFSEVDLNNDGVQDLYIFDRSGRKSTTFLYDGTKYVHAPEYETNFSRDHVEFVLLRDYNCDGIMDIFCYPKDAPVAGIEVYKGYYDSNNRIAFTKILFPNYIFDVLSYPDGTQLNLYVPRTDIPAIDDVDGDGDLDVVSFGILGGRVSYYRNQSVELGYGCDTLIYTLDTDCYGRFFESGISNNLSLSPSVDSCWGTKNWIGGRHAGSSLLNWDLDNDGDKELIIGDISFNNFVQVTNGGDSDTAWMNAQDTAFPNYDIPVNISIFPAGYAVDFDHDGETDLIAAPNEKNQAESREVAWFYKNTNTTQNPTFAYQQSDLLVGEMLDVGRGAAPTYFDYNADSLLDLVIANHGYYDPINNFIGQLALYKNIGTKTNPAFELVDEDWLNLSAFMLRDLHPSFGDLDGDNDIDLILGEETGKLYYFENTAGNGNAATFAPISPSYQGIDVGNMCTPAIVDIDRDGLSDLIIGQRSGILDYYKNTGTVGNPVFTLQTNTNPSGFFGDVDVRAIGSSNGYSAPFVLDNNGQYELYVGSESGSLWKYNDIDNNLTTAFTEVTDNLDNIYEGYRSKIDVRDLNDDGKLEYTIGNFRGGITIFSEGDVSTPTAKIPEIETTLAAILFPNPAQNYVRYGLNYFEEDGTIRVFNALGVLLKEQKIIAQNGNIDITNLLDGVYFVEIVVEKERVLKKLMITK